MNNLDDIYKIKDESKRNTELINYYEEKIKIKDWLINNHKYSIINFKDRTEYKIFNKYHRLNGPAIDYKNEELDKYYFKGILYDNKDDWERVTLKSLRKIKIKKLNKSGE
jgi:hypothetical protein